MLGLTTLAAVYILYYIAGVAFSPRTLAHSKQVKTGGIAGSGPDAELTAKEKIDKQVFIQGIYGTAGPGLEGKLTTSTDIVAADIRGIYDGQSLYDLCNSKDLSWKSSIVMDCGPLQGGYGSVRNSLLTCLRLTIEAGASLVMPQISRRNPEDITDFRTRDMMPLSYLFDEAHFKATLTSYCPQLMIHESLAELEKFPGVSQNSLTLAPKDLQDITNGQPLINQPFKFHLSFRNWLETANKAKDFPIRISLPPKGSLRWPTAHDDSSLTRSFSGLLRPSRRVRSWTAEALHRLVKNHIPPSLVVNKPPADFTLPFIGIHLRTEKDARQGGLTDFDSQANYYLSRLRSGLLHSSLPLTPAPASPAPAPTVPVYIASGDPDQIARFVKELLTISPSIKVLTKSSLLPDSALSSLTWDQQAMVDFQILERASYVMGVSDSSFAWTLALKRAAAANWVVGGFPEGPCWVVDDDDPGYVGLEEGVQEQLGQGDEEKADEDEKRKTALDPAARSRGKRRGCKEDLGKTEYWRDQLSALFGNSTAPAVNLLGEDPNLTEAPPESADDLRLSIWP